MKTAYPAVPSEEDDTPHKRFKSRSSKLTRSVRNFSDKCNGMDADVDVDADVDADVEADVDEVAEGGTDADADGAGGLCGSGVKAVRGDLIPNVDGDDCCGRWAVSSSIPVQFRMSSSARKKQG